MKFKLGAQWLEDRTSVTKMLQRLIDETGEQDKYLITIAKDTKIFEEGDTLNNIYILLDGVVKLHKRKPYNDVDYPIIELTSGSLIGIIAFTTGLKSLTSAKTVEDSTFLRIPKEDVNRLVTDYPRIAGYLDELILANLLERFRQNIILQMKLDSANSKLEDERNELRQAYKDLQHAQNRLVHQEKLATLGQLVAGFAHEVNNPTSAIIRSTDTLQEHLQKFMSRAYENEELDWRSEGQLFFDYGKKSGFPGTQQIRERSKQLKKEFPGVKKSELRLMAQMQEDLIEKLKELTKDHPKRLSYLLDQFEFGKMFQNIKSAGERISGLVQSLKSYSRADTDDRYGWIDIREGIHDTLQLTSNRVKYYEIYIDLPDIPLIYADAAGLNQVWTNIVLNASDVMGKTGSLDIRCGSDDEKVWVSILDSGPGIEEEILEKIFEPNFTTKKTGGKFGLGLGLSISREIVEQHNGTITAENAKEGGARFIVELPIDNGEAEQPPGEH